MADLVTIRCMMGWRCPRSPQSWLRLGLPAPRETGLQKCTTCPRRLFELLLLFFFFFLIISILDRAGGNLIFWQRRRSRINEKMKALQSLIPNSSKVVNHVSFFYLLSLLQLTIAVENLTRYDSLWKILCFKQTDKASMLDEAIEYLKQLQLQVQVCHSVVSPVSGD